MTKTLITDYSEKILLAVFVLCVFIFIGWLFSLLIRRLGKAETLQRNRVYRLIAGSVNTIVISAGVLPSAWP